MREGIKTLKIGAEKLSVRQPEQTGQPQDSDKNKEEGQNEMSESKLKQVCEELLHNYETTLRNSAQMGPALTYLASRGLPVAKALLIAYEALEWYSAENCKASRSQVAPMRAVVVDNGDIARGALAEIDKLFCGDDGVTTTK